MLSFRVGSFPWC